ncbi:MAG: GAF domain-containing protein, partial [Chloroflexi bacterium]|nr:GAF domain-containing protein [Chloroflexota bacterium]
RILLARHGIGNGTPFGVVANVRKFTVFPLPCRPPPLTFICARYHVVTSRQPVLIRDRETDARFPLAPETLWGTMKHARSWLGVPILLGDAVVGIVSVQSYTPNKYSHEEERFLITIADQVAVAIQRTRLFEETQQRVAELEAMNEISSVLRAALTAREMVPALLDATLRALGADNGLALLYDAEQATFGEIATRGWFAELAHALSYSPEGIVNHVLTTGKPYTAREFRTDPLTREQARAQIPSGWGGLCVPIKTTQGVIGALVIAVRLPRIIQPNEARLAQTIAEMAGNAIHRADLYEQTERQIQRLDALRTIDTTISASLDLRVTLNILLEQTILQLGADAAEVLTLNPITQTLDFAAGQGFRTNAGTATRVRLDEGLVARAGLDQPIVQHADLSSADDPRAAAFADEGFRAYYAAPLISKGQFKGVLEVFYRASHRATPEWLEFLDMLAGQTAIAIEIATLFASLQRSNVDLAIAYDSTIESWSRVLDLRDRETEGHTQRVADLTMRLARVLGTSDADLVTLRRGALLHDIGKMAVPDRILRKKGKLTRAEMAEMQRHPQYANQMLSSIEYLRGALDIAYCHHEKWDGSGYPRGLRGEAIPLAARIFAVVDVWDALCSPRSYRGAWSHTRAQAYLRAQSGKHFDPHIVEAFLRMMEEDAAVKNE